MKKSESVAKKVFSSIDDVVSTVENIHGDIAGKKGDKNGKRIHKEEQRKIVYGLIKSINGNVEKVILDFFKKY
jgi:hypothetical protein